MTTRRTIIFVAVAALFFGSGGFALGYMTKQSRATVAPSTGYKPPKLSLADINIHDVYTQVNRERIANGMSPLDESSELDNSATEKCADMVSKNYWSHVNPGGEQPWALIKKHVSNYVTAEENLGYGFRNAELLVKGWMQSEEHKKNILSPKVSEVGYATCYSPKYVDGLENIVVVQHFVGYR